MTQKERMLAGQLIEGLVRLLGQGVLEHLDLVELVTADHAELAKIENMQMQHDDLAAGRAARSTDDLEKIEQELEAKETVAAPEKHFGMVAVCAGKGLAGVFRELGADQIIEGGQTMNPSTQDILEKINATPAEVVFVFPNNKNIIMAAEQTAGLTEKKVVVVPSKTVPQGVSAMLVFDPDASE